MKHFKTITDYCKGINIDPPRHPPLDIRSFEDNMETVHSKMPSFRHEFYAIAIKADGDGKAITDKYTDFPYGPHDNYLNPACGAMTNLRLCPVKVG